MSIAASLPARKREGSPRGTTMKFVSHLVLIAMFLGFATGIGKEASNWGKKLSMDFFHEGIIRFKFNLPAKATVHAPA